MEFLTQTPRMRLGFLSSFIDRFNKSAFYKSVAWVAGGTAAAQAIAIFSSPVVTRLYTPSDYGVFMVFMSILGIIQPISTLTYSRAIPLAQDDHLAHNVIKICFLVTLLISLLLAVVVHTAGSFLGAYFSAPNAVSYLWLLPICLFGMGSYDTLSSWAVRKKYFKTIAKTKVSQGASAAGVKIGLGLLGVQTFGLLLGLLASSLAGCSTIARKLLKEEPHHLSHISWDGIVYAAKRYSHFPLFRTWSRLLLGLNARIPVFFVSGLFGIKAAGLFGLAHAMIDLPMTLIGTSVAQVYYGEITRYGKSNIDKVRLLSLSIIKKMFILGIIPTGAVAVLGPFLFSFVFGSEWHDAGIYAQLLSVIILARLVSSPIMHCFDLFEMQGRLLILNLVRVFLMVVIFVSCKYTGLSAFATIGLYSLGLTLYSVFSVIMVLRTLQSKLV